MDLEFGRLLFSLIITLGVSTALFVVLMRALERRRQRREEGLGGNQQVQPSQSPTSAQGMVHPAPMSIPAQARPMPQQVPQPVAQSPVSVPTPPVSPSQPLPRPPAAPPSRKDEMPVWD